MQLPYLMYARLRFEDGFSAGNRDIEVEQVGFDKSRPRVRIWHTGSGEPFTGCAVPAGTREFA